ncbi:poly(3-hydroxyalkanoate) depolymerase [Bacillus wiedmannii]|uniref:acyl carrier protein n=1 Tax=Bacillus wiedmannii TaxID=1890302 RepID=UPI000BF2A394|nr:acyl carrier protein [Bacillus wiedmannii]PEP90340.1 poly(3-hydroxyalkanoate) depolymerase [Bacillus wiedmannii]
MNKQEIFELVINNIREVLPELEGHSFQPMDQLVNLGANSVDRVEIILMTMEELELRIPRVELSGANNIGELVEVLYEKLQTV